MMAGTALAILWGASLCGLGFLALGTLMMNRKEHGDLEGLVVIAAIVFIAALLVTLSAADVFHVVDWVRSKWR